ncbi:MAG: hypothetical protein BGO67_05015 [Alphaproteobacteria bacterium 41-28]|nr:MAG: hypothetical protein BGO67_05015 [Alphaproteobacteria bacterium 41-28]
MSAEAIISSVLSFWFGEPGSPDYGLSKDFWFQSSPKLDQHICNQFEPIYKRTLNGELSDLQKTPMGALALVIILDQFPRNMYRGTPQAFASDSQALKIAKEALVKGFDKNLLPSEKMFLYLPFQHSENLEDQKKSIELFRSLKDKEGLKYALEHYDIILRFGRFPHRNAILGRQNTPEEMSFLKNSGHAGFGQIMK